MKKILRNQPHNEILIQKMVELSISSGILCHHTAFIGVGPDYADHDSFLSDQGANDSYRLKRHCRRRPQQHSGRRISCRGPFPERTKRLLGSERDWGSSSTTMERKSKIYFRLLIGLQDFDGSWNDLQSVLASGGLKKRIFREPFNPDLSVEAISTLYALAILRKYAENRFPAWELVEKMPFLSYQRLT